jgi:tetratricopeptide (TPR) repeat protein
MLDLAPNQMLQVALSHHQAGRLQQAESLYRQILAQNPRHADALHLLGLIAYQMRRLEVAADLIGQAVALQPGSADFHCNLGSVLHSQGLLDKAIACYQRALALQPGLPEAHNNLGNALRDAQRREEAIASYQQALVLKPDYAEAHNQLGAALVMAGRLEEAIASFQRAVALQPGYAEAYNNLGKALLDAQRPEEAVAACRRAVALKPNYALALNNLGNALHVMQRTEEAVASYQQALALQPDYAEAHNNLGNALHDLRRLDEAVASYQQALARKPDYAEAHNNLGNALRDARRPEEAAGSCRRALELRPDYAEAHNNLGNALHDLRRLEEAVASYRRAVALQPDLLEAHNNLAMVLLLQGDFVGGWEQYTWRNQIKGFGHFPQPLWEGDDLAGRTILLHAEQGFGDTLQFIRYVPLVAKRGGRIIVECPPELHRLLQHGLGHHTLVARGQALPPFDLHCPLMDLPRVLGTTLETIPAEVPYVQADPALARSWQKRLVSDPHRLRIGLAWSGSPTHKNDHNRSLPPAALAPLAQLQGVSFYSLQKSPAAGRSPPPGLNVVDYTAEFHDFADTAALFANLDLIITVDTAACHLAGATARPVWTLLPCVPDWRWLLDRTDSPWYPTMRLFRQPKAGDWDRVMAQVAAELAKFRDSRGSGALTN